MRKYRWLAACGAFLAVCGIAAWALTRCYDDDCEQPVRYDLRDFETETHSDVTANGCRVRTEANGRLGSVFTPIFLSQTITTESPVPKALRGAVVRFTLIDAESREELAHKSYDVVIEDRAGEPVERNYRAFEDADYRRKDPATGLGKGAYRLIVRVSVSINGTAFVSDESIRVARTGALRATRLR